MTLNNNYILVGAGIVKMGAYTAAGAAASPMNDLGHTLSPTELSTNIENFEVITERSFGRVKAVPTNAEFSIKAEFAQAEAALLQQFLRQGSGQLTGTAPNQTFGMNDPLEVYYQLSITGPGTGTNKLRVLTFWKTQPLTMEPIPFAKAGVQKYGVTFGVFRDDSVIAVPAGTTLPGVYFMQVDS